MGCLRTTLAPWARITGSATLAALALLDLAWIVRDFRRAAEVTDVWWMWSGVLFRAQDGLWATSFAEPTLLVLYAVCGALTLARSGTAPGLLASAGALTVALRVPNLWNLQADWVRGGVTDGLRAWALAGAVATLVLGVALIVTAVAGNGATAVAGHGTTAVAGSGTTTVAGSRGGTGGGGHPSPGPSPAGSVTGSVTAAVLLTAVATLLAAREADIWHRQGTGPYVQRLTGEHTLVTLLGVPSGWYAWVLVLLALTAAVLVLRRGPQARPIGMTVSAPLLGLSVSSASFAVRTGLLAHYGSLRPGEQLRLAGDLFQIAAAVAVLLALAPHAAPASASASASGAARMPVRAAGYVEPPADTPAGAGDAGTGRQEETAMKQQDPEPQGGGDRNRRGKPAGMDEDRRRRLRQHTATGTAPEDAPRAEGDRDDGIGDVQDRGTERGRPRR